MFNVHITGVTIMPLCDIVFCRFTGEVIYGSSAVGMYQDDSAEYRTLVTELKGKERTPAMADGGRCWGQASLGHF